MTPVCKSRRIPFRGDDRLAALGILNIPQPRYKYWIYGSVEARRKNAESVPRKLLLLSTLAYSIFFATNLPESFSCRCSICVLFQGKLSYCIPGSQIRLLFKCREFCKISTGFLASYSRVTSCLGSRETVEVDEKSPKSNIPTKLHCLC